MEVQASPAAGFQALFGDDLDNLFCMQEAKRTVWTCNAVNTETRVQGEEQGIQSFTVLIPELQGG